MAGLFGTQWKLTPHNSTFSANFNPSNEARQYDQLENGYKLTVSGTQKGSPYKWSYTAYYDNKPHAVEGRDDVDAITIYKYGDNITGGWFTKNGETVAAYARILAGNTLTVIASGRREGSPYFDTIRYST
jgi:hypothetical protein